MGFVLTLIYISVSLLSPDTLPDALQDIHILVIVAALICICSLPNVTSSGVFSLKTTYFSTALVVIVFGSILATGWIGGAVSVMVGFLPVVAAYYFVVMNFTSLARLKILSFVLFLVMASILVHAMIADHSGVLLSPYIFREREIVRYRGLGVIADPNDLAQVLVGTAALLFLRWKKGAFASNFLFTLLPAAFLCYGVYQTHSRGGLLALVVMVLYGFRDRLGIVRSALLTGLLCTALIAFNATGGRNMNDDDGDRIGLWSAALSAFRTHPLTGVGMDRFSDYSGNGLTAHNSYVLCLAELGLFGYICWMGAIVASWSGLAAMSTKGEVEAEPQDARPALRPLAPGPASITMRQAAIAPRMQAPEAPRSVLVEPQRSKLPEAPRARMPVPTLELPERKTTDIAALESASSVVRSAMAGVLVSAFFISRTYAITLYVVFGMAAALQVMYVKAGGRQSPDVPLLKRLSIVVFLSVLFLYLFIRFRGSH